MVRHVFTFGLNLFAGILSFYSRPHLSGLCIGLALATCFDILRAWPTCSNLWDDHLCNRLKWHLWECRCYCGAEWPRWMSRPTNRILPARATRINRGK
jgi:hypothetical protein